MPDSMVAAATAEPDPLADAIVAEQVRLLGHRRFDLLINLINAGLVAAVLWPLYPAWAAASWLCLFSLVILARHLARRRYRSSPPGVTGARRWGRIFTLNALATASVWSLTGSIVLVTPEPIYQMFIAFVLGGMIAGGMVTNSAYMPTITAFVVPAVLPMILILLSRDSVVQIEMGLMLALFATVVIIAGYGINHAITENLRIRFGQDALLTQLQASEAAMEEAQAVAHVGSWEYDVQTRVSAWTLETFRIFGVDPHTFLPSLEGVVARLHPLDRDALRRTLHDVETKSVGLSLDYRVLLDDGTIRWVHGIARANRDDSGRVRKVIGTVQDITERKQGESVKALLAAIVDSSIDAIVSETTDGTITSWNHAAERLYGYPAEAMIGRNVRLIIPDDRHEEIERNRRAIARGGAIAPFDTVRLARDGTRIPVSIAVSLISDVAGAGIGASFIARDIRERERAAAALAERDRLLHAVTVGVGLLVKADSLDQGMPPALRTLGESLRVDRVLVMEEGDSPTTLPVLPYYWQSPSIEKPLIFSAFVVSPPDAAALHEWRSRMSDGVPVIAHKATSEGVVRAMLEYFGIKSLLQVPILVGDKLWGNITIDSCTLPREWTAIEIDTLKTFGEIAKSLIVQDETRRALARSNERFQMLTTAAQDGIIMVDEAGLINQWNRGAERILGYSATEALGRSAQLMLAAPLRADEADPVMAAGKASSPLGKTYELTVMRKDRTEIAVELSVSAAEVGGHWETIGILRDITQRKSDDTRLRFANVLLKTQMEASLDGILVVDPDRNVVSYNQKFVDIWKLPFANLEAVGDIMGLLAGASAVKDPSGFLSQVAYFHDHPDQGGHEEFEMADGRCIDRDTVALASAAEGNLGRVWYFRDITDRKLAADALAYRERLLHAVTISTKMLVKADSLKRGMPDALRILGETLRVDRVIVMQEIPNSAATGTVPMLRHAWQTADIEVTVETFKQKLPPADRAAFAAWHAPLSAGEAVMTHLVGSEGPVHHLLERLGIKSLLLVPIFVGDTLWGSLGIDACRTARDWAASEIDALKIFGEMTGALNAHDETRHSLARSEKRFRSVTETAQDAIIAVDAAARIVLWNNAAERMLGYGKEEAEGKQVHNLLAPPRFRTTADRGMAHFVLTGEGDAVGRTTELAATRKDGTEIVIELSLAAARVGPSWEAIAILRNVTERKQAEEKLAFANLLLRTQMEASLDGIIVIDQHAAIIAANKRMCNIWNIAEADLAAGRDAVLAKVAPQALDPEIFLKRIQYIDDNPGEDCRDEIETVDGRSIDRYTVTLHGPARVYLGRAWFFRDITERKRVEALALRMARYDVLTGLANRAVFVEALKHAIAMANRGEHGFAVLYLDLDHFKDVNDTLGHPAGDELLKAVADRLQANTRDTDTLARFGGDEFAMIAADIRDPADAAIMADKLTTAFERPFLVRGSEIHTGASIGIATYGSETPDAETMLSNADVALYRTKAEGRGGFRFFTDSMDIEVQARVTLGADLRIAIDAGQLFLLYQPQVMISDGRITGLEALVRWNHPTRGLLAPSLFIPVAEQIGLVGKLGHWVLWEACRQGKAWLDAGIAPGRIAVNVSALQFRTPIALENDIAAALAKTGFPPSMLELELTETVLMDASQAHGEVLRRLRETGIQISIDDFGTGYSSLDYLRRYPSNRIKIAQDFVANVVSTLGDAAIVRATIGLARALSIDVIAEGAETRAQCDLLKSWGCNEVQGYYFARPLSTADATAALRAGRIVPGAAGDAGPIAATA